MENGGMKEKTILRPIPSTFPTRVLQQQFGEKQMEQVDGEDEVEDEGEEEEDGEEEEYQGHRLPGDWYLSI